MISLILTGLLSFTTSQATISDTTVGNGGDVVRLAHEGATPYLLDLVETGVHMDPYFNPSIVADPEFAARVKGALPVEELTQKLVAQKLSEISEVDRLLGHSLLRAIELLRWKMVTYELINVPDEGTVYSGQLYQAAIRQGLTVFLQKDLWRGMKAKNRAALILHELLFALYEPEDYKSGFRVQRSYRIREINAQFFSRGWADNLEVLYRIIHGSVPTNANRGLKSGSSKDEFLISPSLVVANSLYTLNPPIFTALTRVSSDFNIDDRINFFCDQFSGPDSLPTRSGDYYFGLSSLVVRLRRASFQSPLGILDFIQWKEHGTEEEGFSGANELPPFNSAIYSVFRSHLVHEARQHFAVKVIYDFTSKEPYNESIRAEAREACMNAMNDFLLNYQNKLSDFR